MRYMEPEARRLQILRAAATLAEEHGYQQVTRRMIADQVGVTEPLITHYFQSMPILRQELMRHAVKRRILRIIAQGLVARNTIALKTPVKLRKEAISSIQMGV